jgi:hypothetical protein
MATATLVFLTGPWKIKRGALSPSYRVLLRQVNKQPVDLSGWAATFVMRLRGADDPTVEADMTILQEGDAATGTDIGMAEYDWTAGDTDVSGIYDVELLLTDADGRPCRVPTDSYLELQILGNLSAEPAGP